MKKPYVIILLICFCSISLIGQNRWIEDKEMNFKISIPSNYKTNEFWEGSDKIHAFVSPDQNIAVRVRSFKVNNNTTNEQIIGAFSQNVIKGATQLVSQMHTLNGMNGILTGYRWRYNNINVIVASFSTIQNGNGYIVWTLIPESLFASRNAESDAITNSFTTISNQSINNTQVVISDNPKISSSANYTFTSYVSEDAYLEFKIPSSARLKSSEAGLAVWDISLKNGESARMVVQNIYKQALFQDFISEQISSIRERGATIVSENYKTINNLDLFVYEYNYNNSTFLYIAIDGPVSYFLIGFVGSTDLISHLKEFHNKALISIEAHSSSNQNNLSYKDEDVNITPLEPAQYPLKITSSNITTKNTQNNNLKQGEVVIDPFQKKIDLIALHNGKDNGENFTIKWLYTTQNSLVAQSEYHPKINGENKIHSYIETESNNWPIGDYKVEIWHKGRKLSENQFKIASNQQKQSPQLSKSNQSAQNKTTNLIQSSKINKIVLDNRTYGYDFASGKLRTDHTPEPDVMNRPWCTPLPALTGNWVRTGKNRMEDVTTAPSSGYLSDGKDFIDCSEAPINEVLVFKLQNGKYAKLMIIDHFQTKTSTGCEHKITCLVQYPAF